MNTRHMNEVATNAALIRFELDRLDDVLRSIAERAEKLREAATAAANELVRP